MDENCRRVMASRILNISGTELDTIVGKTEGFTAAQFTEFCNRIALQMILKPVSKNTCNEEYIEINDEMEVEIELAD
jgi:hypothetical protein